jgi:hypothetical protein
MLTVHSGEVILLLSFSVSLTGEATGKTWVFERRFVPERFQSYPSR